MDKLWCYTSVKEVEQIIINGKIELPPKGNLNEKFPAIWLSKDSEWDTPPDVILIDRRGFYGHPDETVTWARIEIVGDSEFRKWSSYKALAGIAEEESKKIERIAIENGANPGNWYYSLVTIPDSKWVEVEYLDETGWTQFPP